MTESQQLTGPGDKPSRPVGVWILTLYALIFAGIAPLVLSILVLIKGNAAGNELGIFLSLPLSAGIIVSAIGAWQGKEKARKWLLALITLNYVLVGINNLTAIFSGQVPPEDQIRLWGRAFRGILYPIVYFWYFSQYTTKDFYD